MQGVLAADRHDDYLRAPDLDAALAMLATGPAGFWLVVQMSSLHYKIARYWPGAGYFWHSGFASDHANDDHWSIGAAVSWRDVIRAALPRPLTV